MARCVHAIGQVQQLFHLPTEGFMAQSLQSFEKAIIWLMHILTRTAPVRLLCRHAGNHLASPSAVPNKYKTANLSTPFPSLVL